MTAPEEIPELTASEIDSAKQAFAAQVRRELLIEGELDSPAAKQILAELPSRIKVTAKFGTPEVKYITDGGGRVNLRSATTEILGQVREADLLATFGPNPGVLLAERLQTLGLSRDEASQYASRVERQVDGRVALWTRESGYLALTAMPEDGRAYSPAELEQIRDPKPALARAARAIIAERDQQDQQAAATADTVRNAEIRQRIAGVL